MSDSRELAHAGTGGGAIQPQGQAEKAADRFTQTIQMVREALLNPDVDANKAKVMAEVMTSLEDRAMAAEFNRDLNAAMMEMPTITKAGIITINDKEGNFVRNQGRFARYEDIDRVVRPILQRHNLAIRFDVGEREQQITVQPILSHANGHTERGGAMRLPLETSGSKNNVQGAGSTVSYGKRYTMCALLNIITEGTDDDGSLGAHAIDMPHEREITVLEDAEQAFADGNYQAWFGRQGVKDRAWLVSAGHHVRLGGEPIALPSAAQGQRQPAAGGAAASQQAVPPKRTARAWTEEYERLCNDAGSREELLAIQAEASDDIARLKAANPALHQRAIDAGTKALARLSGGEE